MTNITEGEYFGRIWAINLCTSSEMLAILASAKNTCLDIVHKQRLGLTFFPLNICIIIIFIKAMDREIIKAGKSSYFSNNIFPLFQAILQKQCSQTDSSNSMSVRRFASFGLLSTNTPSTKSTDDGHRWTEYTSSQYRHFSVDVRYKETTILKMKELHAHL